MSTKHTVDPQLVETFLAGHRFALVGASSTKGSFAPTIHKELVAHGYEVVPVHPSAPTFEGQACYPDLASVPGTLDGAIVMVDRSRSAQVVRACAELGIRRVWLFQGIGGHGSVSDEALAVAREHDLAVVPGACPLMFLEPVHAAHRVHRFIRRANRSLARTA